MSADVSSHYLLLPCAFNQIIMIFPFVSFSLRNLSTHITDSQILAVTLNVEKCQKYFWSERNFIISGLFAKSYKWTEKSLFSHR